MEIVLSVLAITALFFNMLPSRSGCQVSTDRSVGQNMT